jgi:hypothetical protein
MYKIVMHNQLYFIGKISDLLKILQDISNKYVTLQSFIDSQLKY